MAEEVGTAFVSILPSLRGFSSRLKADLRRELGGIDPVVHQAGTRAGTAFGSGMGESLRSAAGRFGQILKTGLLVGTAAAVAGLGALTVFGLKSAAQIEQVQIGLEALTGSAQEAKKFLGELQQFAAKTPFEFKDVADASRRILAFGSSVGIAQQQVIPTLTTIGDLVSVLGGTAENINSVVRSLGQIASKGRLQQEEILQLAEALPGFNANAAIAAHLGLSVADSMELITAGGVDAKTAIEALLEGMANFKGAAGAMEKQAQTLLGVFSTFKDTISIALTNAFQPVIPGIKQALTEVTPTLGAAIDQLAPQLGQLVSTLLPLLGIVTQALTPVLGPAIAAFAEFIPQLTPALIPLGEALGRLVSAFAPLVPILADVIAELVESGLVPVIDALTPQIADLVVPIGDLLKALVPLIPPLAQLLVMFLKMQEPLIALIALGTSFLAVEGLAPALTAVSNAATGLLDKVEPLVDFGKDISNWGAIFENLKNSAGQKLTQLGDFFAAAGIRIEGFFRELPGRVVAAISSLPGKLAAIGATLVMRMTNIGRDMIQGLIDGAGSLLSKIGGFLISKLPGWIVGPFKAALGIASPSKVFEAIGEDTIAGYIQGVERSAQAAQAATLGALAPAAAASAGAPAPAAPRPTVNVTSSDPIIDAVIERIRETVRSTFGGDVGFAFGPG